MAKRRRKDFWGNIGNAFRRFLILLFGFMVMFILLIGVDIKITYNTTKVKTVVKEKTRGIERFIKGFLEIKKLAGMF